MNTEVLKAYEALVGEYEFMHPEFQKKIEVALQALRALYADGYDPDVTDRMDTLLRMYRGGAMPDFISNSRN